MARRALFAARLTCCFNFERPRGGLAVEPVDEIVAYLKAPEMAMVVGQSVGATDGLLNMAGIEQILDHYYGGTEMGDIALNQRIA